MVLPGWTTSMTTHAWAIGNAGTSSAIALRHTWPHRYKGGVILGAAALQRHDYDVLLVSTGPYAPATRCPFTPLLHRARHAADREQVRASVYGGSAAIYGDSMPSTAIYGGGVAIYGGGVAIYGGGAAIYGGGAAIYGGDAAIYGGGADMNGCGAAVSGGSTSSLALLVAGFSVGITFLAGSRSL
eukprot:200626-Rhodomonas_salina.1